LPRAIEAKAEEEEEEEKVTSNLLGAENRLPSLILTIKPTTLLSMQWLNLIHPG
jgi:hypothetical protein